MTVNASSLDNPIAAPTLSERPPLTPFEPMMPISTPHGSTQEPPTPIHPTLHNKSPHDPHIYTEG